MVKFNQKTIKVTEAIFPTEKGWEKYPWNQKKYYLIDIDKCKNLIRD